jgi:hypothetical protein
MTNRLEPFIGHWYNHLDKGDLFQVVAIDRESGTIEIQEFDGGLDEFEFDEWRQLYLEEAAAPEDWTGPVDDVGKDDLGYSDPGAEEASSDPIDSLFATWNEARAEEDDTESLPRRPPREPISGSRRRHH